jgi:hypothetical protein
MGVDVKAQRQSNGAMLETLAFGGRLQKPVK